MSHSILCILFLSFHVCDGQKAWEYTWHAVAKSVIHLHMKHAFVFFGLYVNLLLQGLSYEGIQRPLGFVHTIGWCQGPSTPIEAAKDTGVPYVEMILKKNRLSLDIISCLLTRCTWPNIHIVPPHGIVLEIRIAEGYGTRWSEDGIKVYNVISWDFSSHMWWMVS
ncbi:uncharacterized protein [Primulina eburnea]|uniref:uncharacterized protein isoform X2 n=1 Tax=Primulina eburnea TaxID=1245227 RepID=UPI003C6CAB5B